MTANGQVLKPSPAEQIRAKLDDPRVAESLNDLLEHADLLAVLVSGLDGLVRRSDTLGDSLTSAIGEFKGLNGANQSIPGIDSLKSVDLAGLAASFATLSDKVVGATPALNSLLESRLTDPQAVEVLSQLGQALVDAKTAAAHSPKGLFGILKAARDPDVARGLGFLLQVAKSFGRQLR
ncbi:DUF1641 domain-containing protein [Mycolicibacterium lacusdiani]|uniref:DUF1641 domain-containing protein n=1 Tax=Mycolicibacterium lacusdiani TaxID=2895283 RepID=UPI001F488CC9|nr:DUF1641 domain-containing protein [Mycolicibacterium lacusdiani]